MLEYLYSEFWPAAIEFIDKDDGSICYPGKIVSYELVYSTSELLLFFVSFEKIDAVKVLNEIADAEV